MEVCSPLSTLEKEQVEPFLYPVMGAKTPKSASLNQLALEQPGVNRKPD